MDALSVRIIMADFETALRNAALTNFRNARCIGSNVDFDRTIYRKLRSLKLYKFLRENEEACALIQKIIVLAFPPEHLINKTLWTKEWSVSRSCSKVEKFFQLFRTILAKYSKSSTLQCFWSPEEKQ